MVMPNTPFQIVYCSNCRFARTRDPSARTRDPSLECMLNPPIPHPIINSIPGLDPKILKVNVQIIAMRPPVNPTDFCIYGRQKSESELTR